MIDVDIEQTLGAFELDVEFAAEAPIVGLFGRSGAGKSSVVNAIAGIGTPRRGSIRVNGETLFDSAAGIDLRPEQRRVGYVFQDALLFPHLDVKANLLYGQRLRAPAERFIDEARVVRPSGPRSVARAEAEDPVGWREAAGRDRPCPARPAAHPADGRAAGVARRPAQVGDPGLHRAPARRARHSDRLRHPLGAEITRLADTVVVLAEGKCVAVGDIEDVMGRLELQPATGRYEAGSVLDTRVAAHDPGDQLTTLAFDGGSLVVPHLDAAIGERVRARIRARDVSLAVRRPEGISILNVLPARVSAIDPEAGTDRRSRALGGRRLDPRAHHAPVVRATGHSRGPGRLRAGQGRVLRPARSRLRVAPGAR